MENFLSEISKLSITEVKKLDPTPLQTLPSDVLKEFPLKEISKDLEFDLIFDTETTGLPIMKGFSNYFPYTDLEAYYLSRITEICWSGLSDKKTVFIKNEIIKPSGLNEEQITLMLSRIPKDKMKQDVKQIMSGRDLKSVFVEFKRDLRACRWPIAHNSNFDVNIIKSEAYRIGDLEVIEILEKKQIKCTMIFSIQLNSGRVMSLDSLYERLMKKKRDGGHRADKDVTDLTECVIQLREKYGF